MQLTETINRPTHVVYQLKNPEVSETPPAEHHLLTLEEKTLQMQGEMINSPIFDESMKIKLTKWFHLFQQKFLPNLIEFDDKVDAAFALCYLLFGAIYPELNKQRPDEEVDLLFSWEDGIKEFVYFILPYELDRESFIKNYGKFFEEEQTIEAKVDVIQACYQEQLEALLDDANKVNDDMEEMVEQLLKRLSGLCLDRKTQSESLIQRVDALTAKVMFLKNMFEEAMQETEETGNRFEKVQLKIQQIGIASEKIIGKV